MVSGTHINSSFAQYHLQYLIQGYIARRRLTLHIIHNILIIGGSKLQNGYKEEKEMRSYTMITLEGDHITISESDIICISAFEHGTTLRCTNGRQFNCDFGLSAFEEADTLFRCHRGELINLKKIKRIRDSIELDEGFTVPIARRRRHSLIMALNEDQG